MVWMVNHIRESFLQFFKNNGHTIVSSSPLIPHNDPTLMFTNAGMVQFKNNFTGLEQSKFPRAATSQKCVRAGGKHNDLDNVGYTARHHTFFEMLGNFSFGDYFKEQAITLAWNFLTKELQLPAEKLYVTVYHTDDEAFNLWKKIAGLPEAKILRIPTNDNFWAMGDTGPCGPCSEIFYDHGPEVKGGLPGTPEQDGDRYIEIWNLVFMQYELMEGGERIALPKPSIDTGMGMERLAAVLQHVHNNYDIDLFQHLIQTSESLTGIHAQGEHLASHRVIADHLRSTSFLIADGVMPSNEGRGYVLRRIMRRAMRHAYQLGAKEPLMHRLVPALVEQMGAAYPELHRAESSIKEVLYLEEERFRETLGRGMKLLETETAAMTSGAALSGEIAFKLYDTYGFPLDLTVDILRAKQIGVDQAGFEACMTKQKELARKAWSGSGEKATDSVWFAIRNEIAATEFLGYEHTETQGQILALVCEGKACEQIEGKAGQTVAIVTNQTPFYAESGGQMGDHGTLVTAKGESYAITDTKKYANDLIVHIANIEQGIVKKGDTVTLLINNERRLRLRANHSATHLLHAALRKILGEQVTQKGSLVAEDKLRFDISHAKALTTHELHQIEEEVNARIRANYDVVTRLMPTEQALQSGAMALFGEKYAEEVRVVSMGTRDAHHDSIELCGGTHVQRTGDIGFFKITSEGAVAAGIRRIEAITGSIAIQYVQQMEMLISNLKTTLKTSDDQLMARVLVLQDERKKMEKELAKAKQSALGNPSAAQAMKSEMIQHLTVLMHHIDDLPVKELRGYAEQQSKDKTHTVLVLTSTLEGKVALVIAVTPDCGPMIDAVPLVKAASEVLGGSGGGGKPNFAQGGGADLNRLPEAYETIKSKLQAMIATA